MTEAHVTVHQCLSRDSMLMHCTHKQTHTQWITEQSLIFAPAAIHASRHLKLSPSQLIRLTGEYHQRNVEAKEGNVVGPFWQLTCLWSTATPLRPCETLASVSAACRAETHRLRRCLVRRESGVKALKRLINTGLWRKRGCSEICDEEQAELGWRRRSRPLSCLYVQSRSVMEAGAADYRNLRKHARYPG